MYIKEATVYGFIPFDTFGIESISIDAESIIQILIGSNGSGKSALLKELNPLPAIKSMYHKNGGKELLIIHKEDVFNVSSVFGKNSKHSFIMNDKELNTDGTAPLQIELAKRYLGYTSLVHSFIIGKYDFISLRPAERKSLLMNLSTAMPDFMVEMHKYAKSKLREYKSNISLLFTRKQEIENKLDKELIVKLKVEKEGLDKSYTEINNKIYYVEKLINELESKPLNKVYDDEFIEKYFKEKIKNVKKDSIKFRINNDKLFPENPDKELEDLKTRYTGLKLKMDSILENGKETASAIEKLDKSIDELKSGKEINEILNELEAKNKLIKSIKDKIGNHVNDIPLDEDSINMAIDKKEKIFDELSPFLEMRDIGDFVTKDELMKIKDSIQGLELRIKDLGYKIELIIKSNKEFEISLEKMPKDPKTLDRNCETCEYRNLFKSSKDELIRKINENKKLLDKYEKEKKILAEQSKKQTEEYIKLERNFVLLSNAYFYINSYPHIYNRDCKSLFEVGEMVKQDVCKYLSDIDFICSIQQDIVKYHELLKEVSEINMKIKSMKESNIPNMEILEKIRNENRIKRENLIREYKNIKEELEDISRVMNVVTEYKVRKENLEKMVKDLKEIGESYIRNKFISHLKNECLVIMKNEKKEIDDKLFIINRELKEQEGLQERYDKEIMVMLKNLEERKKIYEYIEYSLSPETGLVHMNLIKFVNSLIKNVNFVISRIWTSKLEIVELKNDDDFSCNFNVNCNGNVVKLENLSKGQTKVVNFAWYIALQIALDTKDYPVFFDECDENLDKKHKERYIEWLKTYIDEGYASQMWLVNHDAALYTGFLYKDIICLNKNNIVAPSNSNRCVKIVYK